MSVINQVLNQLERRGKQADSEQTMVRAVPLNSRRLALPLLALLLALAGGIAAWQWMQIRKPVAASAIRQQPASAVSAAVPAAPIAASAAAVAISGETMLAEVLSPTSPTIIESGSVPPIATGHESLQRSISAPGAETPAGNRNAMPVQAATRASSGVPGTRPLRPALPAPAEMEASGGVPRSARPLRPALPAPAEIEASSGISITKQISPAQYADTEFRKAVALMQRGHITDAMAGYEATLRLDASHDAARQAWVALLLESKQNAAAERVLQDGLKNKPEHTGFAMLLARLQVEHGAVEEALETLKASLRYADSQADYQAFVAALLQRLNRHDEAISYYQKALRLAPDNGIWLMGYGISLQAAQRADDARIVYRRAIESKTLSPELEAFVQQKLKGL